MTTGMTERAKSRDEKKRHCKRSSVGGVEASLHASARVSRMGRGQEKGSSAYRGSDVIYPYPFLLPPTPSSSTRSTTWMLQGCVMTTGQQGWMQAVAVMV